MADKKDSNTGVPIVLDVIYRDRKDWIKWKRAVHHVLKNKDVLDLVDMENLTEDAEPPFPKPLPPNGFYLLNKEIKDQLLAEARGTSTAEITSLTLSEEEFLAHATTEQQTLYNTYYSRYRDRYKMWDEKRLRARTVEEWIITHIDASIALTFPIDISLHCLICRVRAHGASNLFTEAEEVRDNYDTVLEAASRSINPSKWYNMWLEAYGNAKAYCPEEVAGHRGIRRFIGAAGRIDQGFAAYETSRLSVLINTGGTMPTLDQVGAIFKDHIEQTHSSAGRGGRFANATLAGRDNNGKKSKTCVCGVSGGHKAIDCYNARAVILNEQHEQATSRRMEIVKNNLQKNNSWKWLVDKLNEGKKEDDDKKSNKGGKVPDLFIGAVLSSKPGSLVAFSVGNRAHHLSNSTIWDTGANTHVVNTIDLLDKGSARKSDPNDFVFVGDSSIAVAARGTRTITDVCLDENGNQTKALKLLNVAVIPYFHVNIVSATLMRKTGLWFCGVDETVRWGSLQDSVVIMRLHLEDDLHFVEYKPLPIYSIFATLMSRFPTKLPCSKAGLVAFPFSTLVNAVIKKVLATSKRQVVEREDSAELWHRRAGHLSAQAIEHLAHNVRGVRITGIKTTSCEACSLAKAKRLISRREPEFGAQMPFYRITVDIFKQSIGYNGHEYFLPITDEYSGMVWFYSMVHKDEGPEVVKGFVNLVRVQYGLIVCKIRMDNDTAFLENWRAKRSSPFRQWAKDEGIDIETPPVATPEENGMAEVTGGKIKDMSRTMLEESGLPKNLWPESCACATYLRNRTPMERNGWLSPLEAFLSWFRGHYRWYEPKALVNLEQDLRPNWSNIRVFGCKAYPLQQQYRAGKDKTLYNNSARAHIGYLVGYAASNIYRVWVPALERVINSRDVTFREDQFFKPNEEQAINIPVDEYQRRVEILAIPDSIVNREPQPLFPSNSLSTPSDEVILDSITVATPQEDSAQAADEDQSTESQNSGVEAGLRGLLTPEGTPEPGTLQGDLACDTEERRMYAPEPRTSLPLTFQEEGQGQEENQEPLGVLPEPPDNNSEAWHVGEHPLATDGPDRAHARVAVEEDRLSESFETASEDQDDPTTQSVSRDEEPQPVDAQGIASTSAGTPPSQQTALGNVEPESRATAREEVAPTADSASASMADPTTVQPRRSARVKLLQQSRNAPSVNSILSSVLESPRPHNLTTFFAVFLAAASREKPDHGSLPPPPKSWNELSRHEYGNQFREACHVELRALLSKGTYRKIHESRMKEHQKPLPLKWVFTYKTNEAGNLIKCKARIVVRGDLQVPGLEETYAHTLAARSLRTILAVAAHFDLECRQFDVVNAFLNSNVSGEVYCQMPPGFKEDGKVLQLIKALYGLRESPLLWYKEFSSFLAHLGLHRSEEEPCVFVNDNVIILFYVDDILVFYPKEETKAANDIIERMRAKYEMREEKEVKQYLGMRIIRDRGFRRIYLALDVYIEKMTARFGLINTKATPAIPIPAVDLQRAPEGFQADRHSIKRFQEKVGSLLYAAVMVRSDISRAVAELSKHLLNPTALHHDAADQCIRYLYGTRYLAIMYDGYHSGEILVIASDASFADDEKTRRSSQGYIIMMYGGPVVWKSSRQDTVTTSTTEAELLALQRTAGEASSLERFFRDIKLDLGVPTRLYCDNLQTIRLVVNEGERINTRLRHVDIQNMWLKEAYKKGKFELEYLATNEMPADGLTKNLPRNKFQEFRAMLNLQDIRPLL